MGLVDAVTVEIEKLGSQVDFAKSTQAKHQQSRSAKTKLKGS